MQVGKCTAVAVATYVQIELCVPETKQKLTPARNVPSVLLSKSSSGHFICETHFVAL